MSKPRSQKNDPDDLTRVDSFRDDEDTGGAGAAPLRPREDTGGRAGRDEPARPTKPAGR